jgi:hypothetical protein
LLSELAEKSGGAVYPLALNQPGWSVKKWRGTVLKSIQNFWVEGVGGGYRITIMVHGYLRGPTVWKLRLDESASKQLRDGLVAYPEKLMPCSNADATVH